MADGSAALIAALLRACPGRGSDRQRTLWASLEWIGGSSERDRLRELVDAIVGALDDGLDGASLASRAFLSRFHFDRVVAAGLGETPMALRRRLLLERAAWQLGHGRSVTDTAWAAGYESVEGFSRAFHSLHGVTPSGFAIDERDFRVRAPNGVHFHPPDNLELRTRRADRPGAAAAGPLELLVEHDRWLTAGLLDAAGALSETALDREVRPGHVVLDFDGPEPSVRAMCDRLVWTKEIWVAAIRGRRPPTPGERSMPALRARHTVAGAEFVELVGELERDGRWADSFIDTLCEPLQAFSYRSVVAHVLTFAAHRRQVLAGVLTELGAADLPPSCPIEGERLRATPSPLGSDRLRGHDPHP
ncbi:MAG: helix-turn-helix domain-containing protein [Acidimicrobiales bacterium]